AASARGEYGGRPQSWPLGLNSSGGAPQVASSAYASWSAQISAPPRSAPSARSTYRPIGMPSSRARRCTAPSCPRAACCTHSWKATRALLARTKRVTARDSGSRYSRGQRFEDGEGARRSRLRLCVAEHEPQRVQLEERDASVIDERCAAQLLQLAL